jgi:membrane protein required for colicin V production
MSWIDLIIVAIIVISALISLVRGFVKESISLASWIIAGFVALRYFTALADVLEPYIESPTIRNGTGFAILFVCSLIVGAIINFMVSQLVSKTGLSGTDKSLGVVFGAARGVMIVILGVMILGLTPMPSESWWKDSTMIEYFARIASWMKDILPDDVASRFSL